MKVRITEGSGWYAGKVGDVFDVYEDDDVLLLEDDRSEYAQRYIDRDHCEMVSESESKTKQGDAVEHPSHYTQGKFEVIEVIEQVTSGYKDGFVAHCVGTATKYQHRAPFKNNLLEDLKKSRAYLNFAIDYLGAKEDGE
jgi:hypothetical protein